jgi:anti-anti-sigma factor
VSSVVDPEASLNPASPRRATSAPLVLSPTEPLVDGGPAEQLERSIQRLLTDGFRHLVVDLDGVSRIDGGGVRALVRGYTTARRVGGSFRLARANADVRGFLRDARLDNVFPISDSIEQARARAWPWRTIAFAAGGAGFCFALVWLGTPGFDAEGVIPPELTTGADDSPLSLSNPFISLMKLVVAALIGVLITVVHRPVSRDKPLNRSMEQAQVLLCVSGAVVMIIIGNSIARAFGIAGAASIIRFRTPVEDPKDITILFLLMGLGMAAGLGAFAVAGLATAFLCVLLLVLDRLPSDQRPREMMVELVADGRDFPVVHVESVFARNGIIFEPRDVSQGQESAVKYHVALDRRLALEDLSAQLTAGASAIRSVVWKNPKKSAR